MVRKWILFSLVIVLVLSISGAVFAHSSILAGYNGQQWFTAYEIFHSERQLISFIGFQEDYFSGLIGITNHDNRFLGYMAMGRQVFLGNLKYQIELYGGNPCFRKDALAANKLGIGGEISRLNGDYNYGVSAEANLIGSERFTIAPYIEYSANNKLRFMVGIGSHPLYIKSMYSIINQESVTTNLFAEYSFDKILNLGLILDINDRLVLSGGINTKNEMSFGLDWLPNQHPFILSLNWRGANTQCLVGYRFEF